MLYYQKMEKSSLQSLVRCINIFPNETCRWHQTDSGIEVLLHMGINTVDLKGEPFTLYVEEGQKSQEVN